MAEFGTEAIFEATVSPNSLRDVRRTVESELGDLEVDVAVQTGSGTGRDRGVERNSREQAMGRRLQSQTIDSIRSSVDVLGSIHDTLLEQPFAVSVVNAEAFTPQPTPSAPEPPGRSEIASREQAMGRQLQTQLIESVRDVLQVGTDVRDVLTDRPYDVVVTAVEDSLARTDGEQSPPQSRFVERRSRENAMSRQVLTGQSQTLDTVSEHLFANLDLNEERNDLGAERNELLRALINEQEQSGYDSAKRSGRLRLPRRGGGGGGALIGGLLGLLGLGTAVDVLSDIEFDVPDLPPVKVPDIPPLSVPEIDPLEVPDIPPVPVIDPGPLDVDVPDLTIPEPDWLPITIKNPFESPTGTPSYLPTRTPGGNNTGTPYTDTNPDETGDGTTSPRPIPPPVYSPDKIRDITNGPTPVTTPSPDGGGSGIGIEEGVVGGTIAAGAEWLRRSNFEIPGTVPNIGSPTVGFPSISQIIGQQAENAQNTDPGSRDGFQKRLADLWNGLGQTGGNTRVAAIAPAASAAMQASSGNRADERKQQQANITVEHSPTYNVDVSDLKRKQDEEMRRLKRKIDDFERSFKSR